MFPLVGFLLDWQIRGRSHAVSELTTYAIYVLAAPIVVAAGWFVCNLVISPHRLLQERVTALEERQTVSAEAASARKAESPDEQFQIGIARVSAVLLKDFRIQAEQFEEENQRRRNRRALPLPSDDPLPSSVRDYYLTELTPFRRRLAELGIREPDLPLKYADLSDWIEFLGPLLEFATHGELDAAVKWSQQRENRPLDC